MANHIAIVHKEPESDFGVSFPDFPGCITAGGNIDEAKDTAAKKRGMSRSSFLVHAAQNAIQSSRPGAPF
jgi:hypothetical protein